MRKEVAKIEAVKLTRVKKKESLPALQKMGDAELERRFNRLCRGNSDEFWAVKAERSRRLADAARERDLSAAKARAEIAAHEKQAQMDKLTVRAIQELPVEYLNNGPEFSHQEGGK